MLSCFLCLIVIFIYQAVFAILYWELEVRTGYSTFMTAILCILGIVSYILISRRFQSVEFGALEVYALIARSGYGLLCLLELNWGLHRHFDKHIKRVFPSPVEKNINLFLIISCIINMTKSIFIKIVKPKKIDINRNNDKTLTKWQKDILKLENYFHFAEYGTELNDFESIIGHMKATMGKVNSKRLFVILSGIENDKCSNDTLLNDIPDITSDLCIKNRMGIAVNSKDVAADGRRCIFNEELKNRNLGTETNEHLNSEVSDKNSIKETHNDGYCSVEMNESSEYSTVDDCKNIAEKEISKASLLRIFDEKNAAECLRILTQGFEVSLNFSDFHENLRQINAERKSLINFIDGSEYSIKILENCSTILELLLILGVFIRIFEISNTFLFFAIPALLFLFPTCISLFDSFLFIVYTHPYDIGDRILINMGKGDDNLIVKSIGLTSTVFERWNNEIVIISNKNLKDQVIKNIKRSKSQSWKIDVMISRKDLYKFHSLKRHISSFVKENIAFREFELAINEISENSFLNTSFIITHSVNYQNGFFMWYAQNRFMKKLLMELKRLKIEYLPIDMNLIIEKGRLMK